jgi:hypothetical protein
VIVCQLDKLAILLEEHTELSENVYLSQGIVGCKKIGFAFNFHVIVFIRVAYGRRVVSGTVGENANYQGKCFSVCFGVP